MSKVDTESVRLVAAARNSNRRLALPPGVELAISEALSRSEVELPDRVAPFLPEADAFLREFSLSQGMLDVAEAFRRIRISQDLSATVCLPMVTAQEMWLAGTALEGITFEPDVLRAGGWQLLAGLLLVVLLLPAVDREAVRSGVPLLKDMGAGWSLCAPRQWAAAVRLCQCGQLRSTGHPDSHGPECGERCLVISLTQEGFRAHEQDVTLTAAAALGVHLDW